MSPLISIIVPIYNAQDYLSECLESIINQSFTDYEVLLVNDGSTDKSGDICEYYANRDRRFRVIHQKNQGVSTARNTGINCSTGKYIAFVDSDDYLVSSAYEKMIYNAEKTNASQVVCNAYNIQNGIITERRAYYKNVTVDRTVVKDLDKKLAFSGGGDEKVALLVVVWNKLYLRKILIDNKVYFEEGINHGEDFLFNISYYRFAESISFIDDLLYYHRVINSSLSSGYREKLFYQESTMFKYYHDWFPEDFDFSKYNSSIVRLNRTCIRYSARRCGINGLLSYLKSVKNNPVLIDSYQYKYNNSLKRKLVRSFENSLAIIPLLQYYFRKVI